MRTHPGLLTNYSLEDYNNIITRYYCAHPGFTKNSKTSTNEQQISNYDNSIMLVTFSPIIFCGEQDINSKHFFF